MKGEKPHLTVLSLCLTFLLLSSFMVVTAWSNGGFGGDSFNADYSNGVEAALVINEVLYDTVVESNRPQHEWFELYNPTSSPVNLYGYVFEDNVHRMKINSYVTIDPYGYLVVCNNVTAFREDYPSYEGKLIEEVNTATTETDDPRDDGNAVPLDYTAYTWEDVYLNNGGDWLKLFSQDPGPDDLNGSDYLVDAVAWEDTPRSYDFNPPNASEVGIWNAEDAYDGYSIQRSPNGEDTNDCNIDFYVYPSGNLLDKNTPGHANTALPVRAQLVRTPETVYSGQAALVFADVSGPFSEMNLSTTVTLDLTKDGSSVPGFPWSVTLPLPMTPIPWSLGWYVTLIPGLPAKTVEGLVYTWKVSTMVSYRLLVDGVEVASDSYTVKEGEAERNLPPLVVTSVYDVLEDCGLVKENLGLGPRGWKVGANEALKTLIVAVDDVGIQNVTFEYSVNDGTWNVVTPTKDPLMGSVEELITKLNNIIDDINGLLPPEFHLPSIPFSIKIYNAQIPGQSAGRYVMFRCNATDIDGNQATSPSGFYFVVNETSNVRVLIVDPHVKLCLLQENVKELLKALKDHSSYQVPSSIIGNMTIVNKVADLIDKYGIEPFHHWETLGKHYNLYIAWPDEGIVDLLKAEGGFEPNVVYLSNLWLGFNGTGRVGPWNWDLRDIEVDGKPLLKHLIEYVKERHAGFIASHGTLSDWVVWLDCNPSQHYKVGARGHVGDTLEDFNIVDEKTVAALLGMPQLSLWEYGRDKVAEYLCKASEVATDPLMKAALNAVALMVGSLPLQVSYVPFNGTMRLTDEAQYVGWDIPEEFTVMIPSVYNEFGFNAYTQVGWQLAMPRALAYTAWWKANETRPLAEQLCAKLSKLVENATSRIMSHENATKLTDEALNWGLGELYRSIINASIMGNAFNTTLSAPDLNETLRLAVDIGREAYEELLQLLPVKLVALSNEGLSAIIVHDKYWDLKGYRAVYFGFEVEATEGDIAEKLLTQAVNWTLQWSFKNITELLGNLVRVPKDLAESFNMEFNALPGSSIYSDGVVLVEEGNTTVTVNASKAGFLHLLIAHPTSGKVNLTVEGAEVYQTVNVTEGLTCITLKVYEAGTVKLSIKADPESSLNPAYLSIKQEADTTPPSINTPSQDPPEDNVQPDQAVTVSVNVTDAESGVREVILSYRADEGAAWTNVTMSRANGDTYVGQIPGLTAETNVQYKIIAYDNAGNFAVNDKAGQYFVYTVIPEFPTWPLLLLMFIVLTAVIILVKKRPWAKGSWVKERAGGKELALHR